MEVEMISHDVIRQFLKTLTPALFLLFCGSIDVFAQSPSESQASGQKERYIIKFQNTSAKVAIAVVGKQMDLNVLFDETVKDDRLTIELPDVTLEQALKTILETKKLQARIIEEKTIIVFPDNEANQQKYKQHELWPAKSDRNK
jgi:type II secretory pathway component GspD/PulD (secretin)